MGQTESRMPRRSSSSAFLLKPKTEMHTSACYTHDHLSHAMACMQGWRAHMEDAHIMRATLPGLDGWSFYAVLDGHAGKKVAEISGQTLAGTVLYEVLPVRDSVQGVQAALRRSFIKHDQMLAKRPEVLKDRSGSTCTSVLVTPTHFIFANVGDSRTILAREGRVTFATTDHKPTLSQERTRINGAGGCVLNGRVDGGLAVSRALGDFDYKMRSDLSVLQQKVSPEPDITVVERCRQKDDFLLLACDGIWDVMNNNAAYRFVQQRLRRNNNDLAGACEALVHRCLNLGSRDNMSAVLVVFNKDHMHADHPGSAGAGATATEGTAATAAAATAGGGTEKRGVNGTGATAASAAAPAAAVEAETEEQIAARIAASVAFSAVASGIAHLMETRSTSVIPKQPVPVSDHNRTSSVVTTRVERTVAFTPRGWAASATGAVTMPNTSSSAATPRGSATEEVQVTSTHVASEMDVNGMQHSTASRLVTAFATSHQETSGNDEALACKGKETGGATRESDAIATSSAEETSASVKVESRGTGRTVTTHGAKEPSSQDNARQSGGTDDYCDGGGDGDDDSSVKQEGERAVQGEFDDIPGQGMTVYVTNDDAHDSMAILSVITEEDEEGESIAGFSLGSHDDEEDAETYNQRMEDHGYMEVGVDDELDEEQPDDDSETTSRHASLTKDTVQA